ncbi:MAG: MATE family efflux transporter [Ruminiclostridium sp.]|nr:MATE family efflux transporter [Ruminiclostridium sp.]
MIKTKNGIDMTSGSILPKLLRLSLPLMLSSVLQLLFNAADIIVVGNFASEHSLAAVTATSSLVNLMTNLFLGFSTGANVLASHYLGARDDERVGRTVHTSVLLSVISGLLLTFIGCVFADDLLGLIQTPPEVIGLSALYLRIYFAGMVAMLVYNLGSSILRAKGDTKRPLVFLTISGVINVGLNLLFVIVFGMDVAGVALATVISQCISAFLIIRCLMKEEGPLRLDPRKLRLDGQTVSKMMKIGIPAGFQGVLFSLSNVVIQSSVNGFGPVVMAGSGAAASIEGFIWVSMNAFSQGALTFTSANVGAGKYSRINRIAVISCACAATAGVVLGNIAYMLGRPLLSIYDSRPEVIEAGLVRMSLVCTMYCTCGLMDCIVGSIRGMQYAITPTIVSLLGACGLRLLWIFTGFQLEEFHTEFWLFMSYPASWITTFLVHLICFFFMRRRLPKRDAESAEG